MVLRTKMSFCRSEFSAPRCVAKRLFGPPMGRLFGPCMAFASVHALCLQRLRPHRTMSVYMPNTGGI